MKAVVDLNELMAFAGCSYSTCLRLSKEIRKSQGLGPKDKIMVKHLAKHYKIDQDDVLRYLNRLPDKEG